MMSSKSQPWEVPEQGLEVKAHLRLRERGRRRGERWPPSSSATLSELRKCLDRKHSSSGVGWKGSWWRRSREDELDWQEGVSEPQVDGQHHSQDPSTTLKAQAAGWSLDGNTCLPGSYAPLSIQAWMPLLQEALSPIPLAAQDPLWPGPDPTG